MALWERLAARLEVRDISTFWTEELGGENGSIDTGKCATAGFAAKAMSRFVGCSWTHEERGVLANGNQNQLIELDRHLEA